MSSVDAAARADDGRAAQENVAAHVEVARGVGTSLEIQQVDLGDLRFGTAW